MQCKRVIFFEEMLAHEFFFFVFPPIYFCVSGKEQDIFIYATKCKIQLLISVVRKDIKTVGYVRRFLADSPTMGRADQA